MAIAVRYTDLAFALFARRHDNSGGERGMGDEAELDSVLRNMFKEQRDHLSHLLHLPPGDEIVICPSGSNAEYRLLLIAQSLLRGDQRYDDDKNYTAKIQNGITHVKEIGVGLAPAASGRHFLASDLMLGRLLDLGGKLSGLGDV